ncbi:pyridoxamine 5'-phosphate oxidase family protein [Microvirga sp. W0021]|uniref:Pyridoxamine 5'-phosphate oxidase family protein n=1 Tax=Hohaiivirga grylli TaxID=3133970 RepID=A0ABV0BG09_9HYPH
MSDKKGITDIIPDPVLGNEGEKQMRKQFPSRYQWDEHTLPGMLRSTIPRGLAKFIEEQAFFFIATSSSDGHCDASFRGREFSVDGESQPACLVINEKTIIFPDFSGNGLYNSLGNILTNPHIGMLFIDFQRQRRARVNGRATIRKADTAILEIWPMAQAVIEVEVEQAYGNCPARIPRMLFIEGSDDVFF